MRLEEFERSAYDMEEEDCLYLVPRLDLREVEDDLEDERGEEEEIVAMQAEERNVIGEEEYREEQAREHACPCLFDAEEDEFSNIWHESRVN